MVEDHSPVQEIWLDVMFRLTNTRAAYVNFPLWKTLREFSDNRPQSTLYSLFFDQ